MRTNYSPVTEFVVGDKVKICKSSTHPHMVGLKGEVTYLTPEGCVKVKLGPNMCYYAHPSELELETPEPILDLDLNRFKEYNSNSTGYIPASESISTINTPEMDAKGEQSVNLDSTPKSTTSKLDEQVGGNHYKNLGIQPFEYCMANNLNYGQSNVIKYVTRYRYKNGKEDLEKAIHTLQMLIELEYGDK